jgi:hypothetical protein
MLEEVTVMGFLENFVNNSKEKRVNDMTKEEMLKALKEKKLDDYVVDLIAKRLGIDQTKQPEGFTYVPADYKNFSEKQNAVRILAGQFVSCDKIIDEKNYMEYLYEKNDGSGAYGFHGRANLDSLRESGNEEFDIRIPQEIHGIRINSLVNAFYHTDQYKINADIQARDVSVNGMIKESGLTSIPDFSTMNANEIDTWYDSDPDTSDWGYECDEVDARKLYAELRTMPNITPQEKLDFVIEHYGEEKDTANKRIAKEIAKEYFGIPTKESYLKKHDIDNAEKTISKLSDTISKNDKIKDCERYIIADGLTDLGKDILRRLQLQLDLKTPEDVHKAYITSLKPEEMDIRMMEVINKNRDVSKLYYIIPTEENLYGDKQFYLFDSRTGELKHEGKCRDVYETSLSIMMNGHPSSISGIVPVDDKMEIINMVSEKTSLLANDVLTNDNLIIPETQNDDREIEEI